MAHKTLYAPTPCPHPRHARVRGRPPPEKRSLTGVDPRVREAAGGAGCGGAAFAGALLCEQVSGPRGAGTPDREAAAGGDKPSI